MGFTEVWWSVILSMFSEAGASASEADAAAFVGAWEVKASGLGCKVEGFSYTKLYRRLQNLVGSLPTLPPNTDAQTSAPCFFVVARAVSLPEIQVAYYQPSRRRLDLFGMRICLG